MSRRRQWTILGSLFGATALDGDAAGSLRTIAGRVTRVRGTTQLRP